MEIRKIVYDLSKTIQKAIKPLLGKSSSRNVVGVAAGGDSTFAIDEIAEKAAENFLKKCQNIAYYSEDKGLVIFGKPEYILIVDPIDGTRPAAAGLESCCVSVAAAPFIETPRMRDIEIGCVQEIKNNTLFFAVKDQGITIEQNSEKLKPVLSQNTDLEKLFWCIGFRGRPAQVLVTVLGDLIDISSVDGAVFDVGSATFSMTRMITGQMDAYIDIGKRLVDEVSWVADEFRRVGKGEILNNNPYDTAASTLIVKEAGCIVVDGCGNPLDNYPIIGSGLEFQFSTLGATSDELLLKILRKIDEGIAKLKSLDFPETRTF
ncbi:MAG: inositol monophosphatase family protein [Candidatus Subteraquimicrobiales bacterium]|nr:inositol monophosphatase family protein [Candidatus Subteraquimicrobiales bacterium]